MERIKEKKKVVIAGGSGMIGSHLTDLLLDKNHDVWWLSRSGKSRSGVQTATWDIEKGTIATGVLDGAYAILNLAGENIGGGRWSRQRKQRIVKSRTDSTRLLAEAMQALPSLPEVFIGASASGYYGDRGTDILTEESPPDGSGFHSQSVIQIEQAITDFIPSSVRTVIPRFGVVLSNNGGAMPRFITPLKFGLATFMGDGTQYMPWIHIHDVCRFLLKAIHDTTMNEVYNVTAPKSITNKNFISALRQAYNPISISIPAPAFILRLVFGEMADAILDSANIVPERLLHSDYQHTYPDIDSALTHLQFSGQ